MAREYRRLLISPERLRAAVGSVALQHPELALTAEESRYLTRVLRYGPGDRFAVLDGAGSLWSARLQAADRAVLEQLLGAPLQHQPQPRPRLVLAAAVVKRDFEVVVRMAVELGVDRLIPLLSERTAVQGQMRTERWRTIAAEAAEQCERLWLPHIDEPTPLGALLAAAAAERQAAAASPALQQPATAPWCFWATTRRADLVALDQTLRSVPAAPLPEAIWLACGPEGGWSETEEKQAMECSWCPVDLGPRILRSSTACVAGLSLISAWRASSSRC